MVHDSNQLLRPPRPGNKTRRIDTNSIVDSLSDVEGCDEENTSRTSDTVLMTSPGRMTPQDDASEIAGVEAHRLIGVGIGTPSTVSTAPSTDDASLLTDYKLEDSFLPNLLQGSPSHSRSSSWGDDGLLPIGTGTPAFPQLHDAADFWSQDFRPNPPHTDHVANHHSRGQALVASFRGPPQVAHQSPHSRQPWLQPHTPHHQDQSIPLRRPLSTPTAGGNNQHPPIPHQYDRLPNGRRIQSPMYAAGQGVPLQTTPPRPRTMRQGNPRAQFPASTVASPHHPSQSSQRSSSEVLKTLLRKKACLYEPDTSRAVALVTWLVGRELALQYGFFSRQQLQAGVHACVANQIDSGKITRTKVNRCMQIILNSCFHYIIPRSDGTEECGDTFRAAFALNVMEDSHLLKYLPAPWMDLSVNREAILEASLSDVEDRKSGSTPKTSPRLASVNHAASPTRGPKESDDHDSKRAVLLCFNENVRSAEDVFRCHNEFIRDTANAAGLQLGAVEWRNFFGKEAAGAPFLWGNVGIPSPCDTGSKSVKNDVFGQRTDSEAAKFRTTWCAKRYEHDHELCGFAHVEVNGGWLRRDPTIHSYTDKMCSLVSVVSPTGNQDSETIVLNECPDGRNCKLSHSLEEIAYHPNRYKTQMCSSATGKASACHLGDVCPLVHGPEIHRSNRKSGDGRFHSPRHAKKNELSHQNAKSGHIVPRGSPVVYASPAPLSSFERQLGMPGLQSLFRRQCSVVRASVRTAGKAKSAYSPFGDDWGIAGAALQRPNLPLGLPKPTPSN